jgi:hypothetical protein
MGGAAGPDRLVVVVLVEVVGLLVVGLVIVMAGLVVVVVVETGGRLRVLHGTQHLEAARCEEAPT